MIASMIFGDRVYSQVELMRFVIYRKVATYWLQTFTIITCLLPFDSENHQPSYTYSYLILLAICVFQEVVLSHFFQSYNLCGQMVDNFKVKIKVSLTSYNFPSGFLVM